MQIEIGKTAVPPDISDVLLLALFEIGRRRSHGLFEAIVVK